MISNTPIIFLGFSPSDAATIINDTKIGFVCDQNIKQIKKTIMDIIRNKSFLPDKKKIENFQRDKLALKLHQIIIKEFANFKKSNAGQFKTA